MFTSLVTFVCARTLYVTNKNRIFNIIPLLPGTSYLSWNRISLTKLMIISNEASVKNNEWQPWIPNQMTFGWRCFLFSLRKIFSELLLFVGPGKDCHVTALSGYALISNHTPTSFPGFSPTRSMEQERQRPWKTLVTWLQTKINSEGGVLCLAFFVSGLFATFTQWSQQQDRFANPTTTMTETKGNFCLNQTIR